MKKVIKVSFLSIVIIAVSAYVFTGVFLSIQVKSVLKSLLEDDIFSDNKYLLISESQYKRLNVRTRQLESGETEVYSFSLPITIHNFSSADVRYKYDYKVKSGDVTVTGSHNIPVLLKFEREGFKWKLISHHEDP